MNWDAFPSSASSNNSPMKVFSLAKLNPKRIWPKLHYALDFNNKIKKTNQSIPQNIS
jgi:hypothetical protein